MSMTYTVARWEGTEGGYRVLGRGLSEDAAIRRIMMSNRLWPDKAGAKAYAEQLGETDTLGITRKFQ